MKFSDVQKRMEREEKAANKIIKQIVKKVGFYSDEEPYVKRDGDLVFIVWESGPYNWVSNDNYYLFEELKSYGMPGKYKADTYWEDPPGFLTEAYNSCAVVVSAY